MNWEIVRAVGLVFTVVYGVASLAGPLFFARRDSGGAWYVGDNFIKAIAALVVTLIAFTQ